MDGGFFPPDSMIWKVDRETALLLGGGRALLMQLAHPKVASGVAEHSRFREDPLGRLQRTMNTMWSIVFDEAEQARTSLRRVRETHRKVRGKVLDGGGTYDARDPDLLLWVHATLVDSALVAYEFFVRPLSLDEKGRYYDDTKKLAALFDVPAGMIPPTLESFRRYMGEMIDGDALAVIPPARLLAGEILHPRPWIIRFGGPFFAFITAGLLPAGIRAAYGLPWNDRKEKRLNRSASWVRRLVPLAPPPLRYVPQARAAQKRLKAARARPRKPGRRA